MKYMGSKRKIAKDLWGVIKQHINKDYDYYIEPFCGGCDMIEVVEYKKRIACDNNKYLIDCFKLLQNGWNPPKFISENNYKYVKNNKDKFDNGFVGYVGFNSYGEKLWGGYRRDKIKKRDYWLEHYNHMIKQINKLKGVEFICDDYKNLIINNAIIYCDPPYKNTTKYTTDFNHNEFWDWVRKNSTNNIIFISEYEAPEDFVNIYKKSINNTLVRDTGSKKGVERLWIKNI